MTRFPYRSLAYDAIGKIIDIPAFQKIVTAEGGYPNSIHGAEIEKCIFTQRIKII